METSVTNAIEECTKLSHFLEKFVALMEWVVCGGCTLSRTSSGTKRCSACCWHSPTSKHTLTLFGAYNYVRLSRIAQGANARSHTASKHAHPLLSPRQKPKLQSHVWCKTNSLTAAATAHCGLLWWRFYFSECAPSCRWESRAAAFHSQKNSHSPSFLLMGARCRPHGARATFIVY